LAGKTLKSHILLKLVNYLFRFYLRHFFEIRCKIEPN
jgi:hypothetical protein